MSPIDSTNTFRLDGRVAIVTGASSGLGQRFASVLAGAGAHVVITARRTDRLKTLAEELSSEHVEVSPIALDLSDPDSAGELVTFASERFGRLDILVNNAGTSSESAALDISVEEFRRVVEMNLVSPFAVAQAAGRVMTAAGSGSIINIASQFGSVGARAALSAYSASKGGLVNLTRHLAAEWAHTGVRVNAIAPGYFASEMTEKVFSDAKVNKWVTRNTPLGRTGNEGELDGALLYLASEASSFVTGSVLAVDGGWTAV